MSETSYLHYNRQSNEVELWGQFIWHSGVLGTEFVKIGEPFLVRWRDNHGDF